MLGGHASYSRSGTSSTCCPKVQPTANPNTNTPNDLGGYDGKPQSRFASGMAGCPAATARRGEEILPDCVTGSAGSAATCPGCGSTRIMSSKDLPAGRPFRSYSTPSISAPDWQKGCKSC